jgi:hypothetical protein
VAEKIGTVGKDLDHNGAIVVALHRTPDCWKPVGPPRSIVASAVGLLYVSQERVLEI